MAEVAQSKKPRTCCSGLANQSLFLSPAACYRLSYDPTPSRRRRVQAYRMQRLRMCVGLAACVDVAACQLQSTEDRCVAVFRTPNQRHRGSKKKTLITTSGLWAFLRVLLGESSLFTTDHGTSGTAVNFIRGVGGFGFINNTTTKLGCDARNATP